MGIGMEIAAPDIEWLTLRWICPVTCGCTTSMSDQCPTSCANGPGSAGKDECDGGICPGASANSSMTSASKTLNESNAACKSSDTIMKSGDLQQKSCAEVRAQSTLDCCIR